MKNCWFLPLFVLFTCQQVQNEHQNNSGPPQNDEHAIYTMDGLEHGLIQSPVNILTVETTTARFVDALLHRIIRIAEINRQVQKVCISDQRVKALPLPFS